LRQLVFTNSIICDSQPRWLRYVLAVLATSETGQTLKKDLSVESKLTLSHASVSVRPVGDKWRVSIHINGSETVIYFLMKDTPARLPPSSGAG
jgi:hypothetical protein